MVNIIILFELVIGLSILAGYQIRYKNMSSTEKSEYWRKINNKRWNKEVRQAQKRNKETNERLKKTNYK